MKKLWVREIVTIILSTTQVEFAVTANLLQRVRGSWQNDTKTVWSESDQ